MTSPSETLAYEKTAALAALEHDLVARNLDPAERKRLRDRVVEINWLLNNPGVQR
jgi:hypothetical protein